MWALNTELMWSELTLFLVVLARMTGCVVFNPVLARSGIPGMFKSGMCLLLAVTAYTMNTAPRPPVPETLLELAVLLLLEMAVGYFLGLVMNLFFYIPMLGGEIIDSQMGMSMGRTYDPSTQSSTTVTSHILNTLMMLIFFVGNGHHTLLRVILDSAKVVPFGAVSFGQDLYWAILQMFIDCTILGIKLAMPILAAELLGQVGMGILMKVIPQINVFAININLKVILGLCLLFLLMQPFGEFLLKAEVNMLQSMQRILPMMAAG